MRRDSKAVLTCRAISFPSRADASAAPRSARLQGLLFADGKMGALMPFGEHKGSGLAIACELIGGALTGSGTWKPRPIKSRAIWNGMLSILINPQQTTTQEQFDAEVASFMQWVKESPKVNEDPVQIAGEPEQQKMQMRMQQGITIDEQTWGDIVEAAKRFGVSL